MLKKWVIYTCVILSLVAVGFFVSWRQPTSDTRPTPTPVIVTHAEVMSQGVHITWLKAQPDLSATRGYIVERSRNNDSFIQLAHVEKTSLQHLDAEGRKGDRYRIITKGAQDSQPSESIIAAPPQPGSNFVIASLPSSHVLGITTPPNQTNEPLDRAHSLQSAINITFGHLEVAAAVHNFTDATGYLHALQNYQRESLFLLPKLSAAEKKTLLQACATHMTSLESILHVLPEDSQLTGMLVQAGCTAMLEAAP